ncbi:LamG-like jellyroll fold domain-containing protein [Microbacterium sp. SLBN-111]|uniref:LamG-like jellyroll fold domain-containing protein n=1 Tax=Microbacterium sp. SLBN-111 TaxID=3377733 RepID=UPI003C74577C
MTSDTAATDRPARGRRAALVVAIAVVFFALTVAAVFAVSGIRLFAIQTPSMGTTAPVGTLVVTAPAETYSTGDVLTFTVGDRTVTHRVVDVGPDGLTTRGDLNGAPDGWTVAPAQVIGRAVALVPGAGFLLTAAPWLLLGGVLTEAITWARRADVRWIWSVRLTGWAVTVTLVTLWLRPWFDVRLLDYRGTDDGAGALLHVVNTGLLPVLAGTVRLVSGEDAVVETTERLTTGAFSLVPVPDPDLATRLLLIAFCLIPLAAALLVRDDDPVAVASGLRVRPDRRARRILVPVLVVTVAAVVLLTTVATTTAAFGARIGNTTDTAATNPFFTCAAAESSTATSSATKGAFAVSGAGGTNEPDLRGASLPKATFAITPVKDTSVGCVRDSPANSVAFGNGQCLYVPGKVSSPDTFTLEAWFRTTTKANGKIIGFGSADQSAADGQYDRHVYLDTDGRIVFGVYPGQVVTIATPAGTSYADGKWHAVVASLSSAGMALYVDGILVATNTGITTAEPYDGYWKIGCGKLLAWANGTSIGSIDYDGPSFFTGSIQYAAIYTRALTAAEVRWHYVAGRP